MNRLTAGAIAVALTLTVAGCSSSDTKEESASTTTSAATASETSGEATTSAGAAAQPAATGTLDEYIKDAGLAKSTVAPDAPHPKVELAVPPGWRHVDPTEDSPYGGLVYDEAVSKTDPPRIKMAVFKLTGNVDQGRVLQLAGSELKSIPGYQSLGEATDKELSGFKAAQVGGSYTKDGNNRLIAQKTVVIPTDGGVFVLQLTADGLESDMGPLMDATSAIDKQTKITP